VNDDAGQGHNAAQPALAVAPTGVVSLAYFTTRNDPARHLLDVYPAQSRDAGTSFLPSVRVTTVSSDPAVGAPVDGDEQFFGDYQGLTADTTFAHPLWTDTRTGQQELFTAAVPSAQPLPDITA
jgi:hypothetical protein